MNHYTPPPMPVVGSRLHDAVIASLRAKGIDATRDAYLAEAQRQGENVDPMNRPITSPSPWESRRGRDNAAAELALKLLESEGKREHTAAESHDAMERVATKTGTSYRDDFAGDTR